MEKIKASDVLKMAGLKYTWINDGCMVIASTHPKGSDGIGRRVYLGSDTIGVVDYDSSTYEIDFSEDIAEERLSLINRISSYLAWQLDSDNYDKIKGFFEEMKSPDYVKGFIKSGRITAESQEDRLGLVHPLMATDEELGKHMSKFIGTQSNSIFQEGDTVHVLSYSNQGEFGVSTQGVVKAIKSNSFIAVEIVNGIEEIHQEKNISFTPFSIHEAGFSQVRPQREPKVGDWGFFYDNKNPYWFTYSELGAIKKNTSNDTLCFAECGGCYLRFSHTPPQLADGIPNPFKEC